MGRNNLLCLTKTILQYLYSSLEVSKFEYDQLGRKDKSQLWFVEIQVGKFYPQWLSLMLKNCGHEKKYLVPVMG